MSFRKVGIADIDIDGVNVRAVILSAPTTNLFILHSIKKRFSRERQN